jgi:hypothetical protein
MSARIPVVDDEPNLETLLVQKFRRIRTVRTCTTSSRDFT